jgi:alkylation response protein AidB-like acyl-CoA dehydrogenase
VITVETFRAEADAWLADNAAAAPRDYGPIMPPDLREHAAAWQRRLFDAGYAGIDWSHAHGGRGLTADHNAAWLEACAVAAVPAVLNMVGLVLAGGAIRAFGTAEQQAAHLPPTLTGDNVWCQLFSEPEAGSDLASLTTRAERDGDSFVVTGQKVWTSGARASDWGILLARTDADAPRHKGISFLLLDMSLPGIEVRPLRQMTAGSEFDEVFLEEVAVPASQLVGPLHGGWGVAMGALTSERGFIGAGAIGLARRMDDVVDAARAARTARSPSDVARRDQLLRHWSTGRTLVALSRRQGAVATAASSLVKLGLAELALSLASTRTGMAGAHAMLDGPEAAALVQAPGARLGGGTSEIQRTIIGELLLGLPKEPRPPKA